MLIFQPENTLVLDTGKRMKVRAVYQMDPVPGCHLHLKNPAGDTVYEAETRVLTSTELSSFLGFYQHSEKSC